MANNVREGYSIPAHRIVGDFEHKFEDLSLVTLKVISRDFSLPVSGHAIIDYGAAGEWEISHIYLSLEGPDLTAGRRMGWSDVRIPTDHPLHPILVKAFIASEGDEIDDRVDEARAWA